ncbi:MAG: hypothetical protein HC908_00925 [Calothrix sp. SM1_7_51]|nr:hypothetical protein [Calothrix sp. SM1_7_51]
MTNCDSQAAEFELVERSLLQANQFWSCKRCQALLQRKSSVKRTSAQRCPVNSLRITS